jgi:hypothetical protein
MYLRVVLSLLLCFVCAAASAQAPPAPQTAPPEQPARPQQIPDDALPLDALIDHNAALPDEDRETILATHGFNKGLPPSSRAWRAVFLRGTTAPGQLLVLDAKGALTLHQGKKTIAKERPLRLADKATCDALGIPAPALPVRIIQDGTTQLLVWHIVEGADKAQQLRVTLLKPIGRFFGRTIERTIAIRPDQDTPWSLTGRLDVLRGQKHHALRFTPLAPDGSPGADSPQLLLWNRWEGIFRTPKPPVARPKPKPPTS